MTTPIANGQGDSALQDLNSDLSAVRDLIKRLEAASCILREHQQYADDPDMDGEGLAADACDDAIALLSGIAKK